MQQNNNADKLEIDTITKMFFNIFDNTNNKQPNWAMINTVCIAQAIIIKKTGAKEEVYTLSSFIEPRKKILTDGTLTNFKESEIHEQTNIVGNIGQRFSTFEKSGYLNGVYFKANGNKFFQCVKTNTGWKINAVLWEDDTN
jgi:hypothetical protein